MLRSESFGVAVLDSGAFSRMLTIEYFFRLETKMSDKVKISKRHKKYIEEMAKKSGVSEEEFLKKILNEKTQMHKQANSEDGMIKYGDIEKPSE